MHVNEVGQGDNRHSARNERESPVEVKRDQRDSERGRQEKDVGEDHPGSQSAEKNPVVRRPDVRHKRKRSHGGDSKRSEASSVVK